MILANGNFATVLQSLVHKCLSKLRSINLNVCSLICDQGPTNCGFLETLEKATVNRPFILHDNRKVYII